MAGATDGLAMGYPPFLHSIPQAGGERRSTPMICGMPWPMMVMIVSISRHGNDIQASTRRCTAIELLEDLGVLVKETNTFQYRHEGKERFRIMGEQVRAFVPAPLPPANPPLAMRGPTVELHAGAVAALSRLAVAGMMVPSTNWFLYGFVRKEAVITSLENGLHCGLLLLEHPGRAAMLADGDPRALEHRPVGGEVALDDQDAVGGFERAVDGVDDVLVGELHLHVLEAEHGASHSSSHICDSGLHYGCDSVARPSDRAHSC